MHIILIVLFQTIFLITLVIIYSVSFNLIKKNCFDLTFQLNFFFFWENKHRKALYNLYEYKNFNILHQIGLNLKSITLMLFITLGLIISFLSILLLNYTIRYQTNFREKYSIELFILFEVGIIFFFFINYLNFKCFFK